MLLLLCLYKTKMCTVGFNYRLKSNAYTPKFWLRLLYGKNSPFIEFPSSISLRYVARTVCGFNDTAALRNAAIGGIAWIFKKVMDLLPKHFDNYFVGPKCFSLLTVFLHLNVRHRVPEQKDRNKKLKTLTVYDHRIFIWFDKARRNTYYNKD